MGRRISMVILPAALLGLSNAHAEDKKGANPFSDEAPVEEKKEEAPKPETRTWTVEQGGFGFTFSFVPGIPNAGQLTEVIVEASAIPKTPHPKFGSRVPLKDARIVIEATNPAGELVGRYLTHAMPLARGKYGFHITPKQKGIYTLAVTGQTEDNQDLAAELKFPVEIWPLPKDLQGSGDETGGGARRPVVRRPLKSN